ncbi:MAG: sigma-70 family RNA polymerase sigma factor [Gemmataceae bacterium]|nr:sigma-70 family RNA polymerase sigma factor [Gemmataceae bacterium]
MTRTSKARSNGRATEATSRRRALLSPCHLATLSPSHAADPEIARMLRVQRDEAGAFEELVETYWTQVFSRFFRQLGDRQEAEDLAQEVFLRLYRSRHRYQPRARFTTWLFHIAQNVARNALRTKRRHPCVPLGNLAGQEEDIRPTECLMGERTEAPTRPLERTEMAGIVRSAVARLGRRQRRAVELFQFHDRSYDQIAREMSMSLQAAKGLLYRARNQLRVCLSAYVEM